MSRSLGVKVSFADAERARKSLRDQGALDRKKAKHLKGVVFPVRDLEFDLGGLDYEVVEDEFEDRVAVDEFESLIEGLGCPLSSFDTVGDIAVLDIPEGFEDHEHHIAEALLSSRKNIKVILKKSSSVEGDKRVRRYSYLAGDNRTKTVHREQGCQFRLDLSKVFFSPRLSFERQRIMEQVKAGEYILDMFAGVGPYSIVIAKHRSVRAVGYDINEAAIAYFKENIRINKLSDRVKAFWGDSTKLASKGEFDRTIMNLPKNGREHFSHAIETLAPDGGVIHYYGTAPHSEPFKGEIKFLHKTAGEAGKGLEILGKRVVRSYSPREVHVAIDVKVLP